MYTDDFIRERTYLTGVSPATIQWYRSSFKAFAGAMASKADIIKRIAELKEKNSNISLNTYLRAVNAYFRWLHVERGEPLIRFPRLKEEQQILATFSTQQVSRLVIRKAIGRNETRARVAALTALDTGMRIQELLDLMGRETNTG